MIYHWLFYIYNFEVLNIKFDHNNIIFIPRISLYRHYHQNSEHTNSRCIPKYESESWSSQLTEIYNQNYLLCNIHRILYNLAIHVFIMSL